MGEPREMPSPDDDLIPEPGWTTEQLLAAARRFTDPDPPEVEELRAEIERLREQVRGLQQDKERLTEVERLLTDYLAFSSIDGRAERQLLRSTMREWLASRSLPGVPPKEEKDD